MKTLSLVTDPTFVRHTVVNGDMDGATTDESGSGSIGAAKQR